MKKRFFIISKENAKKAFLAVFFLHITTLSVPAQTKIYGKVFSLDQKPLVNATVLLLNPKDSSLIKGTLTNESGVYNFENIPAATYLVSSAYTGFDQTYSSSFNVDAGKEKIELKTFYLIASKVLSTITVTAKKPLYEQKIDRLVINVDQAITYTGISALDVLERSPGVRVNRVSNSISVNGKDGVIIMINGKRNYMDIAGIFAMLSGLPSGSIEKIEIITTPPANFDAEGNAGIINIVLKSNDQYGTNGTYTLAAGYSKGAQGSGSLNINHRRGKVNVFGNYSFSSMHLHQFWSNYHAVTNNQVLTEDYSDDNRDGVQSVQNAQAGIDYEINKKTIIGCAVSAFYRKWTMVSANNASIIINHSLDTTVDIINNELHTTWNYGANLNFQHSFKPDEKIIVNADYLYYKDRNPNTYVNTYKNNDGKFLYDENVVSNKLTPLKIWVVASDYSKKLSKKIDFESGIKGTASKFTDDVVVNTLNGNTWVNNSSLSGIHTLNEFVAAAYSSFNVKFSEKNSIKIGLRYEHTHSALGTQFGNDTIVRNYGNLFPSFFLMHKINENTSLNFSYSKRIWRPSFSTLAPWVIFLDPKTFQTGNPGLQPAIINEANAALTYKNKILTISYSNIANPITQQPKIDSVSNQLITSYQNGVSNQSVYISLSVPINLTEWWNIQNYLQYGINRGSTFYIVPVHTEQKSYGINVTQNFVLPKDFSISISGYYYSKSIWGLYTFEPFGMVDCGFQKRWPKEKSTLSFNISNLLNSDKGRMYVIMAAQNLIMKNTNVYGYTRFSLSFTHNFGNDKLKGKRDRQTGAEDEKARAY